MSSTASAPASSVSGDLALLGTLLGVALVLGGGGVGAPLLNLGVQLFAVAVLAVHCLRPSIAPASPDRAFKVLMVMTLALPIAQVVPLPSGLWSILPGRDLIAESLAVIGGVGVWAPVSVSPLRTLLAATALLPALAVIITITRLPTSAHSAAKVLTLVAALGAATVLAGAAQLAVANAHFNIYPGAFGFQLYGFFANHNSAGLALVCALCAVIGLIGLPAASLAGRWAGAGLAATLAIGVLLTQSRSSALLLAIPAVQALAVFGRGLAGRTKLVVIAALAGVGVSTVWVLTMPESAGRLGQVAQHYRTSGFDRHDIWADAWASATRFWPIGSGIGTFDTVFQVDESLETLIAPRAGRAHDEYLELAIEAGIAGVALATAWLVWLVVAMRKTRWPREAMAVRGACAAIVACFLIQALVDYPFRSQALACIAACMIGVLAIPFQPSSQKPLHD